MLKIALFAALLGFAAALKCMTGTTTGDLTSTTCVSPNDGKCYKPKFTSGTGYGTNAAKIGYGCGTCAERVKAVSGTNAVTDCDDSCATDDCNKKLEISTMKCYDYMWDTDKWVKGAAAACSKHLKADFKCSMPTALTGANAAANKFDANKGCGACGTGGAQACTSCTTDSCNVYTDKKCFPYTWDDAKKTYVKGTAAVCANTLAAAFKCNMPSVWTEKAKYAVGTGCGDCPVKGGCPTACTDDSCNSASAMFAILPALLAALYALL